jgi:hypothetical protein
MAPVLEQKSIDSPTQGVNLLQISPNGFLGNWTLDPRLKWALVTTLKSQKMLDLNPDILIYSKHGDISVIFRNNLNEIWGFYINVGAPPPKAEMNEYP